MSDNVKVKEANEIMDEIDAIFEKISDEVYEGITDSCVLHADDGRVLVDKLREALKN